KSRAWVRNEACRMKCSVLLAASQMMMALSSAISTCCPLGGTGAHARTAGSKRGSPAADSKASANRIGRRVIALSLRTVLVYHPAVGPHQRHPARLRLFGRPPGRAGHSPCLTSPDAHSPGEPLLGCKGGFRLPVDSPFTHPS